MKGLAGVALFISSATFGATITATASIDANAHGVRIAPEFYGKLAVRIPAKSIAVLRV